MAENLHKKHRERVRKEFLAHGFNDNSPEHKLLEMLLFFSIPVKDTNPIAHLLIKRFGSLNGVLEAPVEELLKVEGVGENTAMLLKLMIPVTKSYMISKTKKVNIYENMDAISDFLVAKYLGFRVETFAVTTFNSKGAIVGFDVLAQGDCSTVNISMRQVIEVVLKHNGVCAVISHNHPGGLATPTKEDIETTEKIAQTLSNINVKLLDHIVLCDDDYVSFAQSECFRYIFEV